jgi:hypothetical protein
MNSSIVSVNAKQKSKRRHLKFGRGTVEKTCKETQTYLEAGYTEMNGFEPRWLSP